ncbi:MAG: cupin domain-containing protein [Solirubrobacteraceae bacterium]|jgi:mannose-6-phosphate isomerase-like protein (cupin superfamily)
MADEVRNPVRGDGYAAAHLDAMGEGYGFRKVRRVLDVTAFGINAIVLPAGIETGFHYHDVQEETYFVHRGRLEFEFGDGRKLVLGPGGFVRVDASTHRKVRNVGDEDAVYVVVGGKDGYVGREAHVPEGDSRIRG